MRCLALAFALAVASMGCAHADVPDGVVAGAGVVVAAGVGYGAIVAAAPVDERAHAATAAAPWLGGAAFAGVVIAAISGVTSEQPAPDSAP
jgi:hypothetical protein